MEMPSMNATTALATNGLVQHLDASVSPAHSVEYSAQRLRAAGWIDTSFENIQIDFPQRGMIADSGLLLAWNASTQKSRKFHIVGAHTDSPCLKVKPLPDSGSFGWKQIGVEVYGGILNNSWLDRDLGIAGRVVLRDGTVRSIRIDDPIARIPQLAIHLDRDVNDRGLVLDKQIHLAPIWGLGQYRPGEFAEFIASRIDVSVRDMAMWDLGLFDLTMASLLGSDQSLLASGRLDNQVSCWAATEGLIDSADVVSPSDTTTVIALFDHEEVGSESTHGAAGPRLAWLLEALHSGSRSDFHETLSRSHCISADNAHAIHPNYPDRHEPSHRPLPNLGPVLKMNANQRYATNPESAAVFLRTCGSASVPHQIFVSKNSIPCGSTIGPITSTQLGIPTVDVGIAQLSMHSARELCGALDPSMLAQVIAHYFSE
jgi:aspartyl aminopeptidase